MDAWDSEAAHDLLRSLEDLPAHVREAHVLRQASSPVMSLVIRLAVGQIPGSDVAQDAEWAATAALRRREVLAYRSAGLAPGTAERSLRLLDWISALIGRWPEPVWSAAVSREVEDLVDACRRGRRRGEELRARGELQEQSTGFSVTGWLLRHPGDHCFRQARATVSDPWLCGHLDEWISAFDLSYSALAAQDWSAEEDGADVVVEVQLRDPVPHDWKEPAPAVVAATHRSTASVGPELRLRQVEDPDATFNGKLVSLLPGESWLACASWCSDGTVVPGDGTRRLDAPAHTQPSSPSA